MTDEQIIHDETTEVPIKGASGKCRTPTFLFIRSQIVNVVGHVQLYGTHILVAFSDKHMFLYVYYIFFHNSFSIAHHS